MLKLVLQIEQNVVFGNKQSSRKIFFQKTIFADSFLIDVTSHHII